MTVKLKKEDLQFLVNVNLSNRDFLINSAQIQITMCFSFIATLLSIYSVLHTTSDLVKSTIIGAVVIIVCLVVFFRGLFQFIKTVRQSEKFNKQYQNYYFELYPDKKSEFH